MVAQQLFPEDAEVFAQRVAMRLVKYQRHQRAALELEERLQRSRRVIKKFLFEQAVQLDLVPPGPQRVGHLDLGTDLGGHGQLREHRHRLVGGALLTGSYLRVHGWIKLPGKIDGSRVHP